MADIFLTQDVKALLCRKKVVFLGDSNVRAFYKDLMLLSIQPSLLDHKVLRGKMEQTVFGDKLVKHGKKYNGRDFLEQREFCANGFNYSFYFITRVYNNYVTEILDNITKNGCPDVIIINSCLWDMCRWGPRGVEEYRENLKKLMAKLKEILKEDCLVIWLTTPPISQMIKGGFMIEQLEFLKYSLRFHVMEANQYARQVVVKYGFDVLDVHYHLRMQLHLRTADGIHWKAEAVRHVINLLLTHISLAFGVPLPRRYETVVAKRIMNMEEEEEDDDDIDVLPAKKRNVDKTEKLQKVSTGPEGLSAPSTSSSCLLTSSGVQDIKNNTQSVPSTSKSSEDNTKYATFWSPASNRILRDIKNRTKSEPSTSEAREAASAISVQKSSNDPSRNNTKFATFWSPANNGILKDIKNNTTSVSSTSKSNEASSSTSVQSSINVSSEGKKKPTVQQQTVTGKKKPTVQQQTVTGKKRVKNVPWPKCKSNKAKKQKRKWKQHNYSPQNLQPHPFLPYYQLDGTPNYNNYSPQGYNYGFNPNNIPQPQFNWIDMRNMQFGMWSPR